MLSIYLPGHGNCDVVSGEAVPNIFTCKTKEDIVHYVTERVAAIAAFDVQPYNDESLMQNLRALDIICSKRTQHRDVMAETLVVQGFAGMFTVQLHFE